MIEAKTSIIPDHTHKISYLLVRIWVFFFRQSSHNSKKKKKKKRGHVVDEVSYNM